jgi:hypothetical protein
MKPPLQIVNGSDQASEPAPESSLSPSDQKALVFEQLYQLVYEHARLMDAMFACVGRISFFGPRTAPTHPVMEQFVSQRDALNFQQGAVRQKLEAARAEYEARVVAEYEAGGGARKIIRAAAIPIIPREKG